MSSLRIIRFSGTAICRRWRRRSWARARGGSVERPRAEYTGASRASSGPAATPTSWCRPTRDWCRRWLGRWPLRPRPRQIHRSPSRCLHRRRLAPGQFHLHDVPLSAASLVRCRELSILNALNSPQESDDRRPCSSRRRCRAHARGHRGFVGRRHHRKDLDGTILSWNGGAD